MLPWKALFTILYPMRDGEREDSVGYRNYRCGKHRRDGREALRGGWAQGCHQQLAGGRDATGPRVRDRRERQGGDGRGGGGFRGGRVGRRALVEARGGRSWTCCAVSRPLFARYCYRQ